MAGPPCSRSSGKPSSRPTRSCRSRSSTAAAASDTGACSTKCASAPWCTTKASSSAAGARRARSCTTISWKMTRGRKRRRSPAGSFSSRTATDGRPCRLLQALNDADVAHGTVAERAQGFLVAGAVVAGDRLFEAGEFGDDQALLQPGFVGHARVTAAEIAHAERRERDGSELGVGGKLGGVLDLAISRDPVGFGHWRFLRYGTILARAMAGEKAGFPLSRE